MTLPTDTAYKAVDFVSTYTGRAVYPSRPTVDSISIIDIAHHLANQCRYNGATVEFYSTAQHCCLLADYVVRKQGSPLDCLQILMHDAAEAYIVDLPRPIKQHLPAYRQLDYDLTICIRSWLGLDDVPIPSWQDEYDSRIIMDEKAALINRSQESWQMDLEPLGVTVEPWAPRYAEQQFLMRYSTFAYKAFNGFQYLRSGWGVPTDAHYQPQWRTRGSDMQQLGNPEPRTITDLIEVDLRGGVGRVTIRTPDGMMVRDRNAGRYPRPAWEFIHGQFELIAGAKTGEVQAS